ncbi:MAG: hypothetical protein IPI44_10230 [Sulfuritalea sp.]|nr:hypothetical protein [Sulfuritalea sp.]
MVDAGTQLGIVAEELEAELVGEAGVAVPALHGMVRYRIREYVAFLRLWMRLAAIELEMRAKANLGTGQKLHGGLPVAKLFRGIPDQRPGFVLADSVGPVEFEAVAQVAQDAGELWVRAGQALRLRFPLSPGPSPAMGGGEQSQRPPAVATASADGAEPVDQLQGVGNGGFRVGPGDVEHVGFACLECGAIFELTSVDGAVAKIVEWFNLVSGTFRLGMRHHRKWRVRRHFSRMPVLQCQPHLALGGARIQQALPNRSPSTGRKARCS